MEKLLHYFMEETNRKFDALRADVQSVSSDVKEVNTKVHDLQSFKVSLIASARTTSFIVSVVAGFVTLLITVGVTLAVGR